ncbi:WhiB family transcriptional regulator [Streptoalloteichus hindustanus]|uniref:Transcriptional regulator WhiB n=1 Tax=Streptoalloteichus hindustanus TaxID=2017 RepID=A0A1M5JB60_STRHI|nr:WhiB family transcriptional regulator [Streptoalloteichus hindustanus]SHG37490.1 WhiB family transcriptional regulator, redox-sensing transcriptional regulator [Streptoalloteichus hindustanus]
MFTANVPLTGGTLPVAPTVGGSTVGVAELATALPEDELALPCRVNNADLWFAEAPAELERAKRLCADCPVKAQCLAGALARREPWGVWGGEIFERGAVIARKRPRGRPRKEDREVSVPEARAPEARAEQMREQEAAA